MTTFEQFAATGTGRLTALLSDLLGSAQRHRARAEADARFQHMLASDHRVRADLQAARDHQDVEAPRAVTSLPRRPVNQGRGAWLRRYPLAES